MNFFEDIDAFLRHKMEEDYNPLLGPNDDDFIILENHYPELYRDSIIKETKDRPLFYTIFTDSGRIKDIALEYTENFIVLSQVIINIAQFRNYLNDVILKMYENAKETLTLSEIKNFIKVDLELIYSDLPKFSSELSDEFIYNLLESLCALHSSARSKLVLENNSLIYNVLKKLESDKVFLRLIKSENISIEKACKRIFLRNHTRTYQLNSLMWDLERVPEIIIDFPKPISDHRYGIIESLKKSQDFTYSADDSTIVLQNMKFKEVYDTLTNQSSREVREETVDYSSNCISGLIALVFRGDRFIIENATEYVKIRPLIYINHVPDVDKFKDDFFHPTEINWTEAHNIIYSFLYSESTKESSKYDIVCEWIMKNLEFTYYHTTEIEGANLVQEIKWAYPPVLNYSDSPDNIIKATIENQLRTIHGK